MATLDAVRHGNAVDELLAASRALVAVAARSLADAEEVTLPQWRALVVLSTRPGTTVSDLANALGVHSTTATRLCDRLVRKGLVRRTPGVEDRRSIEVHLAPAGTRLVEGVTERRRADLEAIVERMTDAEAAAVAAALATFAEAARERPDAVDLFGWATPPA
jgi:DNA-binding MarR family transcriptional regulator